LLSIGEFAAATQLSAKALRLYDEQRLLQPAKTDPVSGYRYYGTDQVALGRLVRTLRDMALSLADIARVVSAESAPAELLLSQLALGLDQRYVREKRAFQRALLLLRGALPAEALAVEERVRPGMTMIVRPYMTDRRHFFESLRRQLDAAREAGEQAGVRLLEESCCRMIDPLSEEETPVELLVRVETPARFPEALTLRQLPPTPCAAVALGAPTNPGADFSAAVDALFDWFDRRGYRAIDAPFLSRLSTSADARYEMQWGYEPGSEARK
jgi:DNA-binding transcriptional MerR regulator